MELTQRKEAETSLLDRFNSEIWDKVPHFEDTPAGSTIVNPTPLIDITDALRECAKEVYHLDLSDKELRVFGKFESKMLGGSVKTRPAVEIVHDAIATGRLRSGQTIFEATSGNFGIALGQFTKLGLDLVVLVSRKLQEGVFEELRNGRIKTIDLDMDICPAPGTQLDSNTLAARAISLNIRSDLARLGFDQRVFDESRQEIEALLANQDIINLAKLLARIYGGFCPEQYDNDLNALAHEKITAFEIDQQLAEHGNSLGEFSLVCTFGTGGTSTGLSRYVQDKHGKKTVHVVFPLANQDVAGIRTKDKAVGLRFYEPEKYAGQHEVDFLQAKSLMKFFADDGYDIGESSALSLYAVMQMANFNGGKRFVVILADGVEKYRKSLQKTDERRHEVTLPEAAANLGNYGAILWTHTMFVPSKEGIRFIADSLGCEESRVKVVRTGDVENLVNTEEVPEGLDELLRGSSGKLLLVCMAGGTSLRAAKILSRRGIQADSLSGGISAISELNGKQIAGLVQTAVQR